MRSPESFGRIEVDGTDPHWPLVRLGPGYRKITLHDAVRFVLPTGRIEEARPDLISDGATIRWYLWSLTGSPLTGRYRLAALVHDQLCADGRRTGRITPKYAHAIFYLAMCACGIPRWRARIKWLAVTLRSRWAVEAGAV